MFCFSPILFLFIYSLLKLLKVICVISVRSLTQVVIWPLFYLDFFYEELYFATAVVECGNYELCLIIFNNDNK